MRWSPQYHVACRLQDKVLGLMGLLRSGKPAPLDQLIKEIKAKPLRPVEMCSLIKAWESLEDRKRILRGKGLPKPVEAEDHKYRKKKPHEVTFSET